MRHFYSELETGSVAPATTPKLMRAKRQARPSGGTNDLVLCARTARKYGHEWRGETGSGGRRTRSASADLNSAWISGKIDFSRQPNGS